MRPVVYLKITSTSEFIGYGSESYSIVLCTHRSIRNSITSTNKFYQIIPWKFHPMSGQFDSTPILYPH